ncbi:MAG TPA: tRNA uridine-5-carboxymethylaminomethyl(34) synthesis GTPase MnmE [Rhodobacteraceae bacterium]|nr:tRNA uridine-5-carboxymethylaminomethyl(34) synthesis GTPase MnmE [Paracoccaceae bacterium]
MENGDTIFALASARGRAGVAVIRISGPDAFPCVLQLAGALPAPRTTSLRILRDGDEPLDQALVLTFENGASFTGEDVAEFHLHGGVAVVQSVLSVLGKMDGLRTAGPGEFTRRALENNRMDLPQVEGLADLIEAETEAQRKQALRVMRGSLSEECNQWREKLVRAMALLEAVIDFADEDVPVDVRPEVNELLLSVHKGLIGQLSGQKASERIRDGFEVALVGAPNIGKSTLLNAIAGRDVAITSEIAGTTRDVIEVRLDLKGLPVTILDLAGIRDSDDIVESLGIARAIDRAVTSDIRVFLIESAEDISSFGIIPQPGDIVVLGKGDMIKTTSSSVSGKTGKGVDDLLERISTVVTEKVSGSSSLIRQRHLEAIESAEQSLSIALKGLDSDESLNELIAEDLRFSVIALDSLVGRIDTEDVLGEIFAGFCIGK